MWQQPESSAGEWTDKDKVKAGERGDKARAAGDKAQAKEFKRRGFRFVGSTTAYSTMQAAGIVNDHVMDCCIHGAVEAAQREAAARVA